MSSETTKLFVEKRQALPAYEGVPDAPSVTEARDKGLLSKIVSWLFRGQSSSPPDEHTPALPTDERVEVLLPPPPQVYGLATLFQGDPNHDLEAVRDSRVALSEYRGTYKEQDGWPYPFRYHLARHSGVPSFLNGYLEQPDAVPIDQIDMGRERATKWFSQELVSRALFGVDWGRSEHWLEYVEAVLVPWPNEIRHPELEERRGQVWAHARFQQMVNEWPVFGAQVVTHFRDQDPRVSCTSSYFPLRDELTLKEPADLEQAKQTAQRLAVQAVAGEVTGIEGIGLYVELLAPFLFAEDETDLRRWTNWHTQVAFTLIQALSQHDPDRFRSMAALPPSTPPTDIVDALREHNKSLVVYRWGISIVPYAESELFVYPFAGHYYLAYLVELTPPNTAAPWRVFVDTDKGLILGPPENSALHANIFATSGHALPQGSSSILNENVGDLQNEVAPYAQFKHLSTQGSLDPLDLAALPASGVQLELEGVNIAYHARALFRCFQDQDDLGIIWHSAPGQSISASDKIIQDRPIEVIVGMDGNDFRVSFSKTDLPPKGQIRFQTMGANQNGLTTGDNRVNPSLNPRVFAPSLDREIIFHEFAHAFMWKLRFDPLFGFQKKEQQPFVYPLLEGYATFFARSLAVRDDFDPSDADRLLWARAAYRRMDWGGMWDTSRSDNIPGADMLPWPNIYPNQLEDGMQAFEVSMIWARALWDIAWLLASPQVPPATYDGVNQNDRINAFKTANRLALNAYFYLHGLTANYELAAEGIVDGVPGAIQASVKQALKNRGIYAEQGVQALAESPAQSSIGSQLFIGSDQGVARWDGQGPDPLLPMNLPDGTGVVALQADEDFLYAASESLVWKWPWTGAGGWSQLGGGFPPDQLPLSMTILDGNVIVGTSDSLFALSNNTWQPIIGGRMAVNMTVNDVGGGANQLVLISTLTDEVKVVPTTALANPNNIVFVTGLSSSVRATSAVLFGGALYVGTVQGIQRRANFQSNTGDGDAWVEEQVGGAAVLCLIVDRIDNRICAGTTNGLYWRNANGWQHDDTIHAEAQNAVVSSVLRGDDRFVIGTLNQGLFVLENGIWKHQVL